MVIVASLAEDDAFAIKHVRLPHAYAPTATAPALERIIAAFFCPSIDETLTMHFDLFSPAIQKVFALSIAFARLLLERDGADAGTRRLLPPLDEKEDPRAAKTSRVARWYRAVVKAMSRWSMVDGGSNLNVHYDSSSLFLCAVKKGRRRHDTRTQLCSWERALADSEAAVLRAPTFARKTGYTARGFNGVELDVVREKNLSCLSNVKFTLNYTTNYF